MRICGVPGRCVGWHSVLKLRLRWRAGRRGRRWIDRLTDVIQIAAQRFRRVISRQRGDDLPLATARTLQNIDHENLPQKSSPLDSSTLPIRSVAVRIIRRVRSADCDGYRLRSRRGSMWAALPAIASTFADTLDGAIRVVDRRRQCARVCAVLGGGGQKSMIANVVKARRRYQGCCRAASRRSGLHRP